MMSNQPPAVFDADFLLDAEKMQHGPVQVLWNQNEWIEPGRALPTASREEFPKRNPWQRLRRWRLFHILIRIAPPEGTDLETWGRELAVKLDHPIGDMHEGDLAVWMTALGWAPNVGSALGSGGRLLSRMKDVKISQAQIRVWEDESA
jgi:hypothetical protein